MPGPGGSESGPGRYGVERTRCGCVLCKAFCRLAPGRLAPEDLERLCPSGRDVFAWAEEHLRAVPNAGEPRLVPARGPRGHCHWLLDGLCLVHEHAPYGCAVFDAHMDPDEVDRRSRLASQMIRDDEDAGGLYARIWRHLLDRGLSAPSGNRDRLAAELRSLKSSLQRTGLSRPNGQPPVTRPTWQEP